MTNSITVVEKAIQHTVIKNHKTSVVLYSYTSSVYDLITFQEYWACEDFENRKKKLVTSLLQYSVYLVSVWSDERNTTDQNQDK
jgi:hypothetical protein